MPPKLAPKLYLLTNEAPLPLLLEKLDLIFQHGVVSLLQIRRKQHGDNNYINPSNHINTSNHSNDNKSIGLHGGDSDALCHDIEAIMTVAQAYNVPIIINDEVSLAKKFATGVHLGKQDTDLQTARRLLGAQAMIGQTCYNSLARITTAIDNQASYVAMGAVFASSTKPLAQKVSIDQLKKGALLCQQRHSELCVIGGITADNAAVLKGIELDYIAVTADILGQPLANIDAKCEQWRQVLTTW